MVAMPDIVKERPTERAPSSPVYKILVVTEQGGRGGGGVLLKRPRIRQLELFIKSASPAGETDVAHKTGSSGDFFRFQSFYWDIG